MSSSLGCDLHHGPLSASAISCLRVCVRAALRALGSGVKPGVGAVLRRLGLTPHVFSERHIREL